MRILFIADTHFDNYTFGAKNVNMVNDRCEEIGNAFLELIERSKADFLVIAGDVFHKRGKIHVPVFNYVYKLFAQVNISMLIISGNHDMAALSNGHSALEPFSYIENVAAVVSDDIATFNLGGVVKIGCIPYIHDVGLFKKKFKEVVKEKPYAIVCHVGIDDFKVGGMPDFGVDYNFFKKNYQGIVVAGHYHRTQIIQDERLAVVSPGSLVQHNFGDAGEPKGGYVLTVETGKFDFIESISPKFENIRSVADYKGGAFVKIRGTVYDKCQAIQKEIESKCRCSYIDCPKNVDVTHDRPTIKLGTPKEMSDAYIQQNLHTYGQYHKELVQEFEEVSD